MDSGYCDTCHYYVDLTEEGRLRSHGVRRLANNTTACEGTGRKPSPAPPTPEVEAVAFREAAPPGHCPICGTKPPVDADTQTWLRHGAGPDEPFCRGSYTHAS